MATLGEVEPLGPAIEQKYFFQSRNENPKRLGLS
jgi:hypothetical protein